MVVRLKIGDSIKIAVRISNDTTYFYRGKITDLDSDFVTIADIKQGIVRIRLSEIIMEEGWQ